MLSLLLRDCSTKRETFILQVCPPTQVVGDQVVVLASLALDDDNTFLVSQLGDELVVTGPADFAGVDQVQSFILAATVNLKALQSFKYDLRSGK